MRLADMQIESNQGPYAAVCHTAGCLNENEAVEALADVDQQNVSCGPCGQQITDITIIIKKGSNHD